MIVPSPLFIPFFELQKHSKEISIHCTVMGHQKTPYRNI